MVAVQHSTDIPLLDTYCKNAIAEAQLNKVLNDKDLALIDRETYQPRKCTTCKYRYWRFDHLHCEYPGQEKYPGSNDARRDDCPIPRIKILPVIPLAEELKEETMKSSVAFFNRMMNQLQAIWEENENLVTEQHNVFKGIRSSQIAALVLLLIEKGILKE